MRFARVWLVFCLLAGLLISFQNCSTFHGSANQVEPQHDWAAELKADHKDKMTSGTAAFWILGEEDELLPPSFKGKREIFGANTNSRYIDSLRNAFVLCDSESAKRIAFEIHSGHEPSNEGRYIVRCDEASQAMRQPAAARTLK